MVDRISQFSCTTDDFYKNIINISDNFSFTLPFCFPCFCHYPYFVDDSVYLKGIILKIEKKVNVYKILKIHPKKSTKGFVDNIVWCSACDQDKVQLQLNSVTVNEQTDLLEIL